MKLTSFPPLAAPQATVLILGSMPGERSLREHEYYGHPQNAFWDVIEFIWAIPRALPYADRCQKLMENGVALWDVLKHCERAGSLDSSIRTDTEIPNAFEAFLQDYAEIRAIFFNGQKAEKSFRKLVWPELNPEMQARITRKILPSTSPANARVSKEQKCAIWAQEIRGVRRNSPQGQYTS